jgi:hypothetical protein
MGQITDFHSAQHASSWLLQAQKLETVLWFRHSVRVQLPPTVMVHVARSDRKNRWIVRQARYFRRGVRRAYYQNPQRKWNPPSWRFDAILLLATVVLSAATCIA